MKRLLTLLILSIAVFGSDVSGQSDSKKTNSPGITFRIPNGVMPTDWKGFKGMLMLEQRPSGIVIAYPEESESISDLKARMVKEIARMFVHGEKASGEIKWVDTEIPSHKGDRGDKAIQKSNDGEKYVIQITLYERESEGAHLVYGYFAITDKKNKGKKDSGQLLDAEGNGSKIFDSFWKTFPNR